MSYFKGTDMDGDEFWVELDGAEGNGYWIGDPEEHQQRLSLEESWRLVQWFHEQYEGGMG